MAARMLLAPRAAVGLLALLAAVLVPQGKAYAQSGSETAIWSATLTVGSGLATGDRCTGFEGSNGALSPSTFSFAGASYTVSRVGRCRWNPGGNFKETWRLEFDFSGNGFLDHSKRLVLLVGDANAPVQPHFSTNGGRNYKWTANVPNWSVGDTVSLRLMFVPDWPRDLVAKSSEGDDGIRLSWTPWWGVGSPITRHQYRQKREGAEYFGHWTDIPDSAVGGTNATSYTVPNLTLGTVYIFQVRAVNAAGASNVSN